MRLVWSLAARGDLKAIRSYLTNRNPAAAERLMAELLRAAQRLEMFPQLGRPGHRSDIRLMQVPGLPYLLPYRVSGSDIEIFAVFDERKERPEEWT
ncbi:MAG: type II toxin-antitoxin system RelE/ParE family toxin [Hyphomicrobiales bacterium]